MSYSVYSITNIKDGRKYVGVTGNFKRRYSGHINSLRCGRHNSYRLQADWDKGCEADFVFEILEKGVSENDRYAREQYYMDHFKSYEESYGYNISPTAGTTLGRRHTQEAKIKMSITHTGKTLDASHRQAISEALTGKIKSDAHQQKITDSLRSRDSSVYARGEAVGGSKLKEAQVLEILMALDKGRLGKDLAAEYNVIPATISSIKTGKKWAHVYRKYKEIN